MQTLVDTYERLKSKFNQFQTRCLSEKQKKQCGINLVAPPLVLPQEKDRQDQDADVLNSGGELNPISASMSSQGRTGGRMGTRMDVIGRSEDDSE